MPWAWVFLLLLAGEAGKSVPLLLLYGVLIVCAADHALYWLGRLGSHSVLPRLVARFPKVGKNCARAEQAVRQNAVATILFGRYLPLVGRWIGVGAGLAAVPYVRFALWELAGASLTVVGFGLPAHFAGLAVLDAPWFPQAVLGAFVVGTLSTGALLGWRWWRKRAARRQDREEQAEAAGTSA